jgi:hypothetical protein
MADYQLNYRDTIVEQNKEQFASAVFLVFIKLPWKNGIIFIICGAALALHVWLPWKNGIIFIICGAALALHVWLTGSII